MNNMRKLHPLKPKAIRAELAALASRSLEMRYGHRLHAVLLVAVGHSCRETARWLGDDARSIQRWVHAYDLHGVAGLQNHPGSGRTARLTAIEMAQLSLQLAGAPSDQGFSQTRWSGKLLARHLAQRFGIQLSLRHCQRLLLQHRH